MNILVKILLCLWELPQTLIALVLLCCFKNIDTFKNPCTSHEVYIVNTYDTFGRTCFSLGEFIFCCVAAENECCKHESGHSIQSRILGPLYLFIVGIPSVITFIIYKMFKKSRKWYNTKYPEKWANDLGKVSDNFYK